MAGPLDGLKILDLTDERAIYGAKLLADLGADVVRPEPPAGDALRNRGPHTDAGESLWFAFFASSRRLVQLDAESERDRLHELACAADIVIACQNHYALQAARLADAKASNEALVVVDVSSFGTDGPWRDYLAPDLVAGALGGAVATTGDVDTPPLKPFGELNFMVSGVYAAIAALSALNHSREHGEGQTVDVSVHECIASCLEQVFMMAWYAELMLRPEDAVLPRRGATHWSDAYTVFKARGGSIMVTPTPDFDSQLAWLIEEGAQHDLIDEKFAEPENLRLRIERTMEILEQWVAEKDVEALFFEAQSRHSPYGWVLPVEKLAVNPQLEARNWFVPYQLGDKTVQGPGAPYQFSDTAWSLRESQPIESAAELKKELGW